MAHSRAGAVRSMPGPARLLLTSVLHEGAIWHVYIATTAQSGAPNRTQLEFEGTSQEQEKLRLSRPVDGPLLDALHSGAPVSRASLQNELELALRDAGAVEDGGVATPVDTESSAPAADSPVNSR